MKTFLKFTLALVLSAFCLIKADAQGADNYWNPTLLVSSTSLTGLALTNGANYSTMTNTALTMTNTYRLVGKELGLQINIGPQTYGNNQSNLVVAINKSIDGKTWDTLAANTISLTANLTAAKTVTTNITLNSVGWIKVGVYTDALYGNPLTNFQVWATSK